MSKKIPLYFNYIENTFPKLLEDAVNSIKHDRLEVKVVRHIKAKPFTQCLNAIQRECLERNDKCWMFMHCDAEILDNSIIDMILKRYENPQNGEKIASVCACAITDLLILYDTKNIQKLNGWDEKNFKNSYMEIDLHNRIVKNGFTQPILYNMDCPKQMSHKESSSLRNKNKEGSLVKVYSKSYEHDMRNFFRIYHPKSDVDKNAGLLKWKRYVGDLNKNPKRSLNIVFSAGKTASTSIFRSWVNKLPVAHSHCLEWFTIVDFEHSVFTKNILTNLKHIIYQIAKPSYIPKGCVEIKLNLKNGIKFGNVFPNLLFDSINMVTLLRHPVNRRISQFLNSLTCESMNTAINMSDNKKVSPIDPTLDILPQLKKVRPQFQNPSACAISRVLTNVACRENRLYVEEDLIRLFRHMFVGMDHREYNWIFNIVKSKLNIKLNPEEISERGYTIQRGKINYTDVEKSQKDSDSISVNYLVVKMENMNDRVKNIIKDFTGIERISHERNISKEVPIVDANISKMKIVLRNSFDLKSLYKNEESLEFQLVKALGY